MKKSQLMGILNVTPDSFFEASRSQSHQKALSYAQRLYKEGADLIDIGGESTRPGALPVSEEEELLRVIPIIQELKKQLPIPLSIDTMKPHVALKAVQTGADWINDVSGFTNPKMRDVAKATKARLCIMHMQGSPRTMQNKPHYPKGVVEDVIRWLEKQANLLIRSGIDEKRIVIDPGIGFGKTVADNIQILQTLGRFKSLGFPLLLGVSRKSFMGKILNKTAEELLAATLVVNTLAIRDAVDFIRVHDVKEHRDAIDLMQQYTEVT